MKTIKIDGLDYKLRIPIYPDRYSGRYADSVPETSGHHSESIRTVIRRYPDTCHHILH